MLIMKKNLTSWLFSFVIQAKQYGSSTTLDFTKQNFSVECHILFYRQCFVKLSCILLLHWFLLMEKEHQSFFAIENIHFIKHTK